MHRALILNKIRLKVARIWLMVPFKIANSWTKRKYLFNSNFNWVNQSRNPSCYQMVICNLPMMIFDTSIFGITLVVRCYNRSRKPNYPLDRCHILLISKDWISSINLRAHMENKIKRFCKFSVRIFKLENKNSYLLQLETPLNGSN